MSAILALSQFYWFKKKRAPWKSHRSSTSHCKIWSLMSYWVYIVTAGIQTLKS